MTAENNSILFLGTGTSTGVPQLGCKCNVCHSSNPKDKRLRTSALITVNNIRLLIDTGPDLRQQLICNNVSHVDAILITHFHYDHIAGMDDVRPLGEVNVFAEKMVNHTIQRNMPYCFGENRYPGVPNINLHEITEKPFDLKGINIQPIRVMHAKLPILGYRVGDVAYLTDVKTIEEKEIEKLKNLKILVLNALRRKEHPSHLTIQEAIVIAKKINAQQTFFTHASHELGLHKDIEQILPPNIHYAFDNLSVFF